MSATTVSIIRLPQVRPPLDRQAINSTHDDPAPRDEESAEGLARRCSVAVDEVSVGALARQIARLACEVARGQRPAHHTARHVTPEIQETLERRAALSRRLAGTGSSHRSPTEQVVPRSAHICLVGPGVVEAGIVVIDRYRVRAVAMRLELRRGRWRATALEIG